MSEQEYSGARREPPPEEREPKEPKGGEGGRIDPDAWMVTFSDLLTLLMTFFVLIFASQDPVPPETLRQAFGQSQGVFGLFRLSFLENITAVPRQDINEDLVRVFLDEIGALDIEVEQQPQGLVITLPADTYFGPGRTALNERSRTRVDKLAEFLRDTGHAIRVEGHTDNREGSLAGIDPWELSLDRAENVLERLRGAGIAPGRLSLVGYGPSHPRYDNVSRLGRQRNRRVDIVILNRGRDGP